MLNTQDIMMAPYRSVCAHVAVINLFKLRGLTHPSFAEVDAGLNILISASGQRIGDPEAPTGVDLLNFLTANGFVSALVGIPPAFWDEPRIILTRFLDVGCHLLLFFNWRDPEDGSVVNHVTLAEGYNEQGYQVIDGEPGYYPEGELFVLKPKKLSAEESDNVRKWLETHSHGSRRTLPFYSIGLSTPERLALGLTSHALAIYPGMDHS